MLDGNMADVANKVVSEITELVKTTSPEVWQIAIRQVMINGYENLVGSFLFAGLAASGIVSFIWGAKGAKSAKYDVPGEYVAGTVVGLIATVVGVIFSLVCLVDAIDYLANPAFQAGRLILSKFNQ